QNGVSSEEATLQFQALQNAYEVLSDPHEKKWYDDHREQILRGADGDEDASGEDGLDLFRYFSAAVYSGFGSDAKSFYVVYGDLFAKVRAIDALDLDAGAAKAEAAPTFGDGKTAMDAVNAFYQHWKSYLTQRAFAWVDEYKTTDAPTRQVRRAMEKENKKLRDVARKAYTTEVRELVDFVSRRDPRVRAFQKQKELEKERRRLEEEAKKREKQAEYEAERLAFQQQQQERWADKDAKTSRIADRDIELELEKLRKKMDADVLLCDLCNKTFKSTKQLQNHVTSKKHREKEQELGVFSDLSILDDEMDRALQEELVAAGKLKGAALGDKETGGKQPTPTEGEATVEEEAEDEEEKRKREEEERVRVEKDQKAAEKRRERKEKRKEKKKENVEKIVSGARSKKEKEAQEEEEEGRGRGKKGGKKRR
ncbi:hypothetical protein BBJ28_00015100, partial [Nothophytophthora sp. Chile5]